MKIGPLMFDSDLIQGPLAGYSCAPFRKLFTLFTPPAYCVTEMISAYDLVHNKHSKARYVWRDPKETRLCYQLAGHCPQTLAEAARMVSDLGADMIDLNCGCPKTKIRKKKYGSYLLKTPGHIAKIIEAIKSAVQKPVTVKIRVDGNSKEQHHLAAAQAIEQAGADAIIVHGRHWAEDYETPCHYRQIAEIVEAVKIPVIGNGDVRDLKSLQEMREKTNCAGVMISRAGTGRPWLFQQLALEFAGKNSVTPSLRDRADIFFSHIIGLAKLENDTVALLQSRSLVKYYFRNILTPQHFQSFYLLKELNELETWLRNIR